MPPAVIAAAVTGAAAVGGAAISGKAAKKAAKAEQAAAAANNATQERIYNQQREDLLPYVSGGYPAVNALQGYLGLSGTARPRSDTTTSTAANANRTSAISAQGFGGSDGGTVIGGPGVGGSAGTIPEQSGGPDWDAYLQAYPDVAKNAQERVAAGTATSPEQVAQEHYELYGRNEGRTVQDLPVGTPQEVSDPYYGDYGDRVDATRPDYALAPTFETPQYGDYADKPDLSYESFANSPGFKFLYDQGVRGLNASAGARGGLQSGDAAKEAIRYGNDFTSTKYGEWEQQQLAAYNALRDQYNADRAAKLGQFNTDRASALSQYNTDRGVTNQNFDVDTARSDARYDADRAYGTARFDTKVSDLFRLAGLGSSAATSLGNFGSNFASGTAANNNNAASATGNAAIAGANGVNSAIGNALGAYSMYSGLRSGSGASPTAGGSAFNYGMNPSVGYG